MRLRAPLATHRTIAPQSAMLTLLLGRIAWAQVPLAAPPTGDATPPPVAPPAPNTTMGQTPAGAAAPPAAAAATPAPPQATPAATAPAVTAPPVAPGVTAPAAAPADAPPPTPPSWFNNLKIGAFADAYYSVNFNNPHPTSGTNTAVLVPGGNGGRAYDFNNGFSLHWAGVDAVYTNGSFGATVGLRFGPSTVGYNFFDNGNGAQFIKQAYATWKPLGADGKLTLDLGKYDQPFGSEVADSQLNINYTRTFLYWLGQPLHFTGLRVDYPASDQFDVKLFVANAWNHVAANNTGVGHIAQNFGTQIMLKPVPEAMFMLGYMVGANQDDVTPAIPAIPPAPAVPAAYDSDAKTRLRHFVDFVADVSPIPVLRFLANADYGTEKTPPGNPQAKWYGANLVISLKASDEFFIAPRGEIYVEDHWINFVGQKVTLTDATLTAGYTPSPNFVLRLDLRADHANQPVFPSNAIDTSKRSQYTATLGAVVMTN